MYPILLLMLIISALAAAAFAAALVSGAGKTREFDLPETYDTESIVRSAARLAVMPPADTDVKGDIALACGYIKKAYKITARKIATEAGCDEYELRFADNFHIISSALSEIKREADRLVRAARSGKVNIVDLAQTIVKHNGGMTDKELVRRSVNAFMSKARVPYSEITVLGAALKYAVVKQLTVYASKIVYRYRVENKARADARTGNISEKYISSLVYVKTLLEYATAGGKQKLAEYCGKRGRNVFSAASEDARALAEYCGGIESAIDSLRTEYSAEYYINLSAAGKVYELRASGWRNLSVKTQREYLELTEKAAKKSGEFESAVALRICELAEKNGKDISEFVIPPPSDAVPVIIALISVIAACALSVCVFVFLAAPAAFRIIAALILLPVFLKSSFTICVEAGNRVVAKRIVPELRKVCYPPTALVVCAAIGSAEELRMRYRDLLTLMKANDNAAFSYGLLLDCVSGYAVSAAEKEIYSLVHGTDGRLFVCLRKRATERKRGALIDFNRLVLYGDRSPYSVILGSVKSFKYAVTLDSDSRITDMERLVRIMEHPYNARYSIGSLSMRASTSSLATAFARLISGEKGISSYTYSSGLFFNSSGFASYTGKGIYRIKETNESVADAFPDGRILSHDMIEGALSGCCDTGVCGTDDFPSTLASYLSRAERWMRGDLQLLPYLRRGARNRYGRPRAKKICFAAKLSAIVNALDVFVPVAAFCSVVLAAAINDAALLAAAFLTQIIGITFAFALITSSPKAFLTCLARNAVNAALLPAFAFTSVKAVLYVILCAFRKKGYLRWRTYTAALEGVPISPENLVSACVFAVMSPFVGVVAAACCALCIAGCGLSALLCSKRKEKRISGKERDFALDLAEKTWEYFRRALCALGRTLPPDNFADDKGWADRTSPTNIGMAICAAVCACELRFINEAERAAIVGGILDETEKLEKYRGCPYNWYSVTDGAPLSPKYVSFVDCGNFLASLLVAREFVKECSDRANAMIDGMDMSFLRDCDGLFRIGYNVETRNRDAGRYDLLASESALTYLVLIACGKTDKKGYLSLSRRAVAAAGKRMLASWSGGAFEYLLPLLFFRPPEFSLLSESASGTLYAQKKYAAKCRSDIWGASESLYAEKYDNGDLKYRAFGVPEISLSSERARKVFAPYASAMYFGVVSREKTHLSDMLRGYVCDYGAYDSVDCTANKIQRSAMSHHQGMILMSLCAALCGDVIRTRLLNDAGVRAASLLLDEEAVFAAPEKRYSQIGGKAVPRGFFAGGRTRYPQLNFMTDGKYRLIADAYGRTFSACDVPLTRFDKNGGLRIFVRKDGKTFEPAAVSDCFCGVNCNEYFYTDKDGALRIKCGLLFGENAEIRQIFYENFTDKPIVMSVIAGAKPTLCPISADLSHKTFSSMFVETRKSERGGFVYAVRTDLNRGKVLALFTDLPTTYCGDERYAKTHKGVRFGRTTEPWLGAESELIVSPRGTAGINVVMAYGTEKEVCSLADKISDESFINYSVRKSAAYGESYFSEQTRNIAALLLCGGKKNGVPREIAVRADDDTSEAAEMLLRELYELGKFGARFTVLVTGNLPYSYSDRRRAELLEAAERLGDRCRIADMLSESDAVPQGCIDAFGCFNALLPPFAERTPRPLSELPLILPEIVYPAGIGGYTTNGAFLINGKTPSPWCNVISDGEIGCITSEDGGFTFARNSRQQKYTRHSNDELNDEAGDGIVLGECGTLWSVTRSPLEKDCKYAALHDCGYSVYYCGYNGIRAEQRVFVHNGVKYVYLLLDNPYSRKRVIDVMYFAELVMGDFYRECAGGIECGAYANGICAAADGMKLYLTCSEKARSTAYYTESYRDGTGRIRVCTDLYNDGMTPALAYSCRVTVAGKGVKRVVFAMSGKPVEITEELAERIFENVVTDFSPRADVESGGLLGYCLKWFFYQTYAARFTARCGFQQVSGATGFRDRLQDCTALTGAVPEEVKKCILECAARQFPQGDVMHWWHEPSVGVRTHICDDKLFLPYAATEYAERTGDESIFTEAIPYLIDKTIPNGEHSVYASMETGALKESLRAHIMRAFRSVKLSPRGLVLMGTGDWNDGMDRVGEKGRGESVWCTMFAYYVAGKFLPYADERDRAFLAELRKKLKTAAVRQKRGDRYIRAYDDDGKPIGVEENSECKIDLLVQSWAVLSGIEKGESAKRVLESAYARLYDKKYKLIKLLDPPFSDRKVGYISNYPPGVRENGGQYTHAAVWFIRALYEAGLTDKANELLLAVLPITHTADKQGVETYLKEPYVIAGDVYSDALAGRGGWTWYTGSAGWLYRVIVENYFGINIRRGAVKFSPAVPAGVKENLTVRLGGGSFALFIDGTEEGEWSLTVDGVEYGVCRFPITSLEGKTVRLKRRKTVD